MRNLLLASALVLIGACTTAAQAAPADSQKSWGRADIHRDWQSQYSPMNASMNLWLTRRVRLPNGQWREESFSCWLRVDVRVSFAPLRAGEEEDFEVEARSLGLSGDNPLVAISVRPRNTYYHYFGSNQRTIVIHSSSAWENLSLSAGGRMRMPAPTTVDKMSVQHTTPASPVVFTWRDFGASDNPGSTAEYRFRVGRVRTLAPDVVVAQGELGPNATVTLTPDSQYAQGNSEYFQPGEKYRLVVWMRRKNSDVYSEEYGLGDWGTFTFKQGSGILQSPAPARVPHPRQERFDALYSGR